MTKRVVTPVIISVRKIASLSAACLLVINFGGCADAHDGLPYYRDKELTPEWVAARVADAPDMHRVGAFQLVDQRGEAVTERVIPGRITVVHFFYASCGRVCPRTQSNLAKWLRTMPNDARLQVLSHTVQPERDRVAVLAEYAAMHAITDMRWRLLTGPRRTIEGLAASSYFVNLRDGRSYGTTDLEHTETLTLLDQQGRLRGVYNGTLSLDLDRLAEDARRLLAQGT